jgi:iron complex outermembrane receptor protein
MRNTHDDYKLDYFNTERISYGGLFGQLEYKNEKLSAYVQAAISNQTYQRFDYHTYVLEEDVASDQLAFLGYNAKAGANYNINEMHNVYANFGYYSRQPFFDDLFLNYRNDINEEVGNEGVLGIEVGYGLRSEMVDLNLDLYSTQWTNRQLRDGVGFDDGSFGTAYYENVSQNHMGAELEVMTHPVRGLDLGAFASIGSWTYAGDITARVFDEDQDFIGESTLYLDGVSVGDAAQTSFGILATYTIFRGFRIDADWRYYDRLFASIDPTSFVDEDHLGSVQLPSFNILDAGLSYKLYFQNSRSLMFRFNVNNVLNKQYISQSDTNYHYDETDGDQREWNGINMDNRVFFGNGITWNFGVTFAF